MRKMKFQVIWNEESYGNQLSKTVLLEDFIKNKNDWNLQEHSFSDLIALNIGETAVECSPFGWDIIIVKISHD